ncbi:MAG TPA: ribonuclease P protein component [Thermoanaerobaculia bacterium]|nr:ribonuclease P protein component [Thermoanaerobaculia bacterium]
MNSGRVVGEKLSRDDRLRKRTEFEECYVSGVRVSGRHLLLFLLSRPDAARPRIGISVSKRVGDAVTRNRVKRRIRELFRRKRPAGAFQIVVNARPSAAGVVFSELERDFRDCLGRAILRANRT